MADIVYVLGMQRSGSTAFERLLASHDGTVPIGEARSVWTQRYTDTRLCACGKSIRECEFWSTALTRAFGPDGKPGERALEALERYVDRPQYVPAMHHRLLRSRRFSEALGPGLQIVSSFYDGVGVAAAGRLVIESTKVPWYAHLLSTIPGHRVAFVHLVRDSRAVAHSYRRARVNPDEPGGHRTLTQQGAVKTAGMWDATFALSLALAPYIRGRMIHVRYEDLARNPDATVARVAALLERLGMQQLGARRDDADPAWYHSAAGNPMRFTSEFTIKADDEWRTALPATSRLMVAALTSPFLAMHARRIGFRS